MKKALHQKSELIRLIQIYLRNELVESKSNQGVERYFHSFLLLLRLEEKKVIQEFLLACIPLLQRKRIPFFSLNTFIKLYEKWKFYPSVLRDVQQVALRVQKVNLSEDFYMMLIRISGNDQHVLHCQEARLTLLTCAINNGLLDVNDLNTNHSLIHALLTCNVPKEHVLLLRSNLQNDKEHAYWAVFSHIRRMKQEGVNPLDIQQMIRIHFYHVIKQIEFNDEYVAFMDILYHKLPANFMSVLYFHEVNKLYFIFKNNPKLFTNWQPEIGDKLDASKLIQSLFREFIVSSAFIKNFCTQNIFRHELEWFAHVLKGNNIVTAKNLPLTISRKAAHIFRCLDEANYTVSRGLIFSAMQAEVNDTFFSRQVLLGLRDETQAAFWVKTMSILHRNGLTPRYVIEVMDYIAHKVYVEGVQLDLKRKKIANLLADVQVWHRQVNELKIRRSIRKNLPNAGVDDHVLEFEGRMYEISQIRKEIDLYEEGQHLSHCVYTYKGSCYNGRCYIFSLRKLEDEEQKKPLITIELRNKQVVQAKGKFNRLPDETETQIIRLWAKEMGFSYVA